MINWHSEDGQTFLNLLCEFAICCLRSYGIVSLVQNLFFVPIILEESKCTRAQVSSDPGESLIGICIASGDPELKSIVRFRERTNPSEDRSKGCVGVMIDGLTSRNFRRTHLSDHISHEVIENVEVEHTSEKDGMRQARFFQVFRDGSLV
jgi:hypothetical protein